MAFYDRTPRRGGCCDGGVGMAVSVEDAGARGGLQVRVVRAVREFWWMKAAVRPAAHHAARPPEDPHSPRRGRRHLLQPPGRGPFTVTPRTASSGPPIQRLGRSGLSALSGFMPVPRPRLLDLLAKACPRVRIPAWKNRACVHVHLKSPRP